MTDRDIKKIADEEGFREKLYACSEGYMTIGYGFNVESISMPKCVADLWLQEIVHEITEKLLQFAWFERLDNIRRTVIIDMTYQLGLTGMLGFRRMIDAIKAGNYKQASLEMLDSKYARQTPARAHRNAQTMMVG